MSDGRDAGLRAFLAAEGWADAEWAPLPRDASFRRYVRLRRGGATRLAMDAPPEREPLEPFVRIAARLRGLGFSAPEVEAADLVGGFALIEDFGDRTYTRALAAGGDEVGLYRKAAEVLAMLHQGDASAAAAGLAPYDDALLAREVGVFVDWMLPEALPDPAARADAAAALTALLPALFAAGRLAPAHLTLRDFHVDNLMDLPDRAGHRAVGLLDFQDAVLGPTAYDVVSLIADARRDVAPAAQAAVRAVYHAAFPALDRAAFDLACAALSAQRNLKILGIFVRQLRRDGRAAYLGHLPRVWRLLAADCAHPGLGPLAAWLAAWLPPERRAVPVLAPATAQP